MKLNKGTTIFAGIVGLCLLVSAILKLQSSQRSSSGQAKGSIAQAIAATPTPGNDNFYAKYLKSYGLAQTEPVPMLLNQDGFMDVITAVYDGCASCHADQILIFKDKRNVFTYYGDDAQLSAIAGKGFVITKPVRKDSEGMCCSTEYAAAIYLWDRNTFVKKQTTSNWVDDIQAPG